MIVLDASAAVDIVLDHASAPWLMNHMAGQAMCAPAHQPAEVLSALARLRRGDIIEAPACRAALEEASELNQEIVMPSPRHLLRALELQPSIRVTDGLYVALAEERGCSLLTTDLRLARSVSTCEVLTPTD